MKIFLILLATVIALAFITFESKVVVEIKPLKNTVTSMAPTSEEVMTKEFFQTQFEVIKSEETLKDAVELEATPELK